MATIIIEQNKIPRDLAKYFIPLTNTKGNVWTIPTQPSPEAHFATFPKELVRPMIKAGCPRYVCKKCGKARVKLYDIESYITRPTTGSEQQKHKQRPEYSGGLARTGGHVAANRHFKGYSDCSCNAGFRPGVVLDPFCGTGKALQVAVEEGMDYLGIDLQGEYVRKFAKPKLREAETNVPVAEQKAGQKGLFDDKA